MKTDCSFLQKRMNNCVWHVIFGLADESSNKDEQFLASLNLNSQSLLHNDPLRYSASTAPVSVDIAINVAVVSALSTLLSPFSEWCAAELEYQLIPAM